MRQNRRLRGEDGLSFNDIMGSKPSSFFFATWGNMRFQSLWAESVGAIGVSVVVGRELTRHLKPYARSGSCSLLLTRKPTIEIWDQTAWHYENLLGREHIKDVAISGPIIRLPKPSPCRSSDRAAQSPAISVSSWYVYCCILSRALASPRDTYHQYVTCNPLRSQSVKSSPHFPN